MLLKKYLHFRENEKPRKKAAANYSAFNRLQPQVTHTPHAARASLARLRHVARATGKNFRPQNSSPGYRYMLYTRPKCIRRAGHGTKRAASVLRRVAKAACPRLYFLLGLDPGEHASPRRLKNFQRRRVCRRERRPFRKSVAPLVVVELYILNGIPAGGVLFLIG